MRNALLQFIILSQVLLTVFTISCTKPNETAPSPTSSKSGVVKGKVSNEYNQLLPGTLLTLQGNGTNTSAAPGNGNYIFDSLQPGSYNLSVKKDGYIETSAVISITPGDTTTKDFIIKAGTAYFNLLSDSVIVAKPYTATFTIRVASNTNWTVNSTNNWIIPDKPGSGGDDSIVVRIAASPADTIQQGILVLQAGSIVKNILVKQLPDVKLLQTTPIPGNSVLGIKDSIALLFNQPVTVKSIFPGFTTCQSDIKISYEGNKVTFSYACAALGADYPFTITTNNSFGDQYNFAFSVNFYQKAIKLTGAIQNYFVDDADNSYWIITDHPNALYKIDMTTFEIIHTHHLPGEPAMFTINPYNNKIYLAYSKIPKLYIMNQDGTTEQVIDITRDTVRNLYEYNGPYIYPSKLVFTESGKGMLWLGTGKGGYSPFWYIDAAANHRIWYQTAPGNTINYYLDGKANYDKTKLVLTSVNSDATYNIFDPQQMTFNTYRPGKADIGGFVTPSRKNGNIYIGQLYFQSIANPATGFETQAINKDNRSGGNMDFCYKPGKDLSVYFTENGSIQMVNYATRTSPVKYDATYYLSGTTATLDGKFVIVYQNDGNYNARVIQLPAEWFDY